MRLSNTETTSSEDSGFVGLLDVSPWCPYLPYNAVYNGSKPVVEKLVRCYYFFGTYYSHIVEQMFGTYIWTIIKQFNPPEIGKRTNEWF